MSVISADASGCESIVPVYEELLEKVPCPLCNGTDAEFKLSACDRLYGQPGDYSLVECRDCHLKYVNPRPTFEGLARHYPPDYFASRPPEESPFFLRPVQALQAMGRIRTLERMIGRFSPGQRVLDVGCGANELVNQFRRMRKCEGIGVEFNSKVVEYVRTKRGLPIVEGTLRDAGFADASFDLTTMMEYLEHEANPREVLLEARRVTRTGGHLAIEIPFIDGLPARVFGSRWATLDFPRHLVFFTPDTLKKMLAKCGFRLLRVEKFGVPLALGISFATALGYRRLNRMSSLEFLLMSLLSLPFAPFAPLLPEFMFAVAEAV